MMLLFWSDLKQIYLQYQSDDGTFQVELQAVSFEYAWHLLDDLKKTGKGCHRRQLLKCEGVFRFVKSEIFYAKLEIVLILCYN
jgi:hypothetical protein